MASNWSKCGVCDYRQITKPSVVWCSECDEGLCGDCNEHHSISRASRNHDTVSIAEYRNLPTEILQIAQFCKIHNEKYELFCRKHDSPCCKKCVKMHNDCKDLTDINEIISNVKTSNAFYDIEQTIFELAENVRRIRTNREDNLKSLEIERGEIEAEIKQTRIKLNKHLDKLQDEVMKELMTAEQTESKKLQKLLTTLKSKETEIADYQANICNVKQHASELQTFLAIKHIEKDLKVEEKFIRSITESDTTNQVDISCQINKSVEQITESIKKFAEISISHVRCDLFIQKQKERQAQIMVVLPDRNIDNLALTLQKRIDTKLLDICGCYKLPDGRIIISCLSEKKVSVFKSDGSKDFEIDSTNMTFDVVFIGDDSIAVTSMLSHTIDIFDLKKPNPNPMKSIEVNSYTGGVVYMDGHLIYCACRKGLRILSFSDGSITNISQTKLPEFAYITSFGDKLFYTNFDNHSVTCCDNYGYILWTFCDKSVLQYPLGISVDNDGNVFVAGWSTNNVVAISQEGKHCRQLLSHADGLDKPNALYYDITTNTLLVANQNDEAFLFKAKFQF